MPRTGRPELTTVAAWIRMRIPAPPAPMMLTGGPPPPPEPPLPGLTFRPVPTDPRPRFFGLDLELEDGVLTFTWNADDPEHLIAELRVLPHERHVAAPAIERFWEAVRANVRPIGDVSVEASDPAPPRGPGRATPPT